MKKIVNKNIETKLPFSHTVIISVLAIVSALGGYGGYAVYRQYGQMAPGFDENLHVVERVVDGDTIVLEDKTVVRLLLIDAPELDQCFGQEAKKELEALVLGHKVRLQKDSTATDNNGRLLRYVFIHSDHPKDDNLFVNNLLLQGGFAKLYTVPRDKLFEELLANSAGVAKNNLKGLYSACPEVSDIVEQKNPKCDIKGNNTSGHDKRTYYLPGCLNYANVKMEKKNNDEWFCTEKEAIEAGYTKALVCPKSTD